MEALAGEGDEEIVAAFGAVYSYDAFPPVPAEAKCFGGAFYERQPVCAA
jgi:hypothetical protein